MREIKFRAWNPEIKEMWHDFSICGKGLIPEHEGNFFASMSCNHLNQGIKYAQEYGKLVLMQFTGLYDRDGKEIYEGDILAVYYPDEICGAVRFGECMINGEYRTWGFYADGTDEILRPGWAEDTKIIGNIHENPELLAKS